MVCRARPMSAVQWRTSPRRNCPVTRGWRAFRPVRVASVRPMSPILRGSPLPRSTMRLGVYRTLPENGNERPEITLQSGEGSTSQPTLKLSVVIPARNEARNIGPTLDALRARLGREGIDYEVL